MAESNLISKELEELRQEVAYLRRISESTMARLMQSDNLSVAIRHELEQKRRGFRLMAELAVNLNQEADHQSVFVSISRRLNAALNMQRTAVLTPENEGFLKALVLQGYPAGEREIISAKRIKANPEIMDPIQPVLITSLDPANRLASFRKDLALPFLISAPVIMNDEIVGILVTGRLFERLPFYPRLGRSDVESIQTVSAYLAAILANQRLRQVESLAYHDPLTKLPNLRKITERLRQALATARREAFITAVMFIDLDGFKAVNDTYGHAAGDVALRIVADRLTSCVRETDLVGRIGGDEFVVVLANIKKPEYAGNIADKIIKKLSTPMDLHGAICQVGASVGIALYPEHGLDESALLRVADEAMYVVKSKGKNNYGYGRGQPDQLPSRAAEGSL